MSERDLLVNNVLTELESRISGLESDDEGRDFGNFTRTLITELYVEKPPVIVAAARRKYSNSITVSLTDKEFEVLNEYAAKKDLSPERVLIQALHTYQLVEENREMRDKLKSHGHGDWIDS